MIRASRLVLSLSVAAAMAVHAAGLWVSDPRERIEIEAGAAAAEAMLGSSFADMVAGAAQPVSETTVTANRQSEQVVTPTRPGEALRPEVPETAQTPPPKRSKAAPSRETSQETVQAPPLNAATPVEIAALAETVLPKVAARPSEDVDRALASGSVAATATPVDAQTAQPATAQAVVEASPDAEDGLQVSHRPQARPRAIEEAAANRQPPEPTRRETLSRRQQGNTAARDAVRGSTTGRQTATDARQGSDTASRSATQGNAAASNYPGLVMRHLARVPRPRADARGAALVQFTIGDGGRLASVGLARSSGSVSLDRAALAVIQSASPFPAPPQAAQRIFSIEIKAR